MLQYICLNACSDGSVKQTDLERKGKKRTDRDGYIDYLQPETRAVYHLSQGRVIEIN